MADAKTAKAAKKPGAAPKGSGLYTAKANGYGNYEIGNIPVGEYYIIVVSGKTHRDIRQPVDEDFTIEENQTLDFSHDFGYTFY
ncbi:hypothetical protein FB479_102359 [Brevibacillus sp. AG162]|uniref:hypothetical protein n=1 Tax=Brevibacillus sp. AG162 TaxID=2572910 RepID=UPI00116B617F|nr:hypothetical protein [Brevibacillus sp. AG162]TQK73725.1 hypothetical protein FB479_102359 [Brevibacillus sp. AG162]